MSVLNRDKITVDVHGAQTPKLMISEYRVSDLFGLPSSTASRKVVIGKFLEHLRKCAQEDWNKPNVVGGPVSKPSGSTLPAAPRFGTVKQVAQRFPVLDVSLPIRKPNTPGDSNVVSSTSFVDAFNYVNTKRNKDLVGPTKGGVTRTWTNMRTGVDNPGFAKKIQMGINATTPLTANRVRMKLIPGLIEYHWFNPDELSRSVDYDSMSGYMSVAPPTAAMSDAAMLARCDMGALAKLHSKLAKLQRSADVGETLAEFRQALSMVGKPLAGLQDLVKQAHRRGERLRNQHEANMRRLMRGRDSKTYAPERARAADESRKAAGKIWLEFWFGWYPLAKDLEAAVKALETYRNKVTATGLKASYTDDKQLVNTLAPGSYMNYGKADVTDQVKLTCTVRYQIGLTPEKVKTGDYAASIGLSPDRFVPTLYAILPYSWLFDYFTRFNVVIDALCANIEFVIWTCKTVRWTYDRTYSVIPRPDRIAAMFPNKRPKVDFELVSVNVSPFICHVQRFDVTRSVPSSLVPAPVLQVPGHWKPYANIVALLAAKTPLIRRAVHP